MEGILDEIGWEAPAKPPPPATTAALRALAEALQAVLPLLTSAVATEESKTESTPAAAASSSTISASWLYQQLQNIPTELGTDYLVRQVWEASRLPDEARQQTALFDVLGASEEAMQVMFTEIAPNMSKIALLSEKDLQSSTTTTNGGNHSETLVDLEEERRRFLLREAQDAAQMAAIAQAEVDAISGAGATGTHSVARASDKQAIKWAQKAQKRAAAALQRAKDAGAIVDESDLLQMDTSGYNGMGGLAGRETSQEMLYALQSSLLPEGSRQYYDKRGLPKDTITESTEDYEKAIIPAPPRDVTKLPKRLVLTEILSPVQRLAFKGTTSLNPMQSAVYERAFNTRDNLLVCAPTGAGKTNVAMLTVVAHFRDVGLLPADSDDDASINVVDTGRKVIYIAPMKALAQEVVEKFSDKLKPLRLIVRELTGDMQLTRAEAESANVIVTTPEKWDVVTRKSGTDENSLGNQCGLLIIDEVHLLADERGAVIESVVSRLHRLVESRQRQTRIVGLSATLPNYEDVSEFLQVPDRGLFFFGPEHRPVPLQQTLIGIHTPNTRDRYQRELKMNNQCYEVVVDSLKRGYQVMVFVHSRKGTSDTAKVLTDLAAADGTLEAHFSTQGKEGVSGEAHKRYADRAKKSRNREVGAHFLNGFGIHHAGMLRGDRKLTEQMFSDGAIKVLCCTATLAWGVNMPVHTVVIKGTEVYNPEKGKSMDLSILDVQQIFGRAGRPQFDTSGEAVMITTADAYTRYMDKLVRAVPIESNFIKQLDDHLNAEIVGGTVTTIQEAATWLKYTYLYIRMLRNPLAYGISMDEKADDPLLNRRCTELVSDAATRLASNRMIKYHKPSGNVAVLNHGRVAAHYYIQSESVEVFNEKLFPAMSDAQVLKVIAAATEFQQMKVRQEELDELGDLLANSCPLKLEGAGMDDAGHGLITGPDDKAFVLMQAYIGRARVKSFTLISDMNYIASNAGRVARAIFEMCLKMNEMAGPALKLLRFAKSVDNQIWWFQTPLRHFAEELKESNFSAIESRVGGNGYSSFMSALSLLDMQPNEVGEIARWSKNGSKIQSLVGMLPNIAIECTVQPVTSHVLRFQMTFTPLFEWHGRWHGGAQSFWMWVENGESGKLYHYENILFSRRTFPDSVNVEVLLPAFTPMPSHYIVRVASDSWVACELMHSVPLTSLKMPTEKTPWTDLLNLTPLPTSAVQEPRYVQLYSKIETFNPIQTQLFHVLYHSDSPVFLGAPTGSGKTISAELAILRMKQLHPRGICVYIAPLKSLARERLKEWQRRLGSKPLGWRVLELSGDTSHDQSVLEKADILICTPEKWDLVSRGWRGITDTITGTSAANGKTFVKRVKLLVLDEVHLLGEERGAVLEAIVSRTRFISHVLKHEKGGADPGEIETTRIIGLSTALENPLDLASWIGIDTTSHKPSVRRGMYNFRSSVRPVPIVAHVQGFSGRHYCPRMATMNKPCFAAIKQHSPEQPALIFVASRRQTRLTALDLISYAAAEEKPRMFLNCSDARIEAVADSIHDDALKHTITFGIGLHHAGLSSHDREIVETLYLNREIQVLVATATVAWGVNLPAHLVIVKGTEYYDGKTSRYVDYPLTDVLQMMGRAGRPGFDVEGIAVIMCVEDKRDFYKKFLYIPFPLESRLSERLCENLNAEIASGTVSSVAEAVGYLNWTYYARRMRSNPSYYGAKSGSDEDVDFALLEVVKETLTQLSKSGCVDHDVKDPTGTLTPTPLGVASCSYYLLHESPKQMQFGVRECRKMVQKELEGQGKKDVTAQLTPLNQSARVDEISLAWLLYTLCNTHEFDELPVRHNEEILNEELSEYVRWGADTRTLTGNKGYHSPDIYADPHTKAFLLIQAYLETTPLPISDYVNDTKSIVENVPRLLAAMEYIAASDTMVAGGFDLLTQFARARQHLETKSLPHQNPLLQIGLPTTTVQSLSSGAKGRKDAVREVSQLRALARKDATTLLQKVSRGKGGKVPFDTILDRLYAIPSMTLQEARVINHVDKATGKSLGKLKVSLALERTDNNRRGGEVSLTILVGSLRQGMLLGKASIRLVRWGKWTVSKEVMFDWNTANADGGEDGGSVVVRYLWNEVRGFDQEMLVPLR